MSESDCKSVSVARYIVEALKAKGVKHVFMVPGGFVDNFAKALVEAGSIKVVVCASEAGAAMMADGYARATGEFGVCLAISGPGASNMITGLSLSKADRIPVLAITGDNPLVWRNRGSIQDAGIQGLASNAQLAHAVDKQFEVIETAAVSDYLKRAVSHMASSDPGPVHLSVPMDIQIKETQADYSAFASLISKTRVLDCEALDRVSELLQRHAKAIMLVGSGVRKSGAFAEVVTFAEQFGIPVATTMSAKGDFPEDHPLSMGVFGWAGSELANETLMHDDVECIFVVGSRLGQIATMCWNESLVKDRCLIQMDVNAAHLDQTYTADLSLVSDAQAGLAYLSHHYISDKCDDILESRRKWWKGIRSKRGMYYVPAEEFSGREPLHPGYVISRLSEAMPSDVQVFVDNGAHTFFMAHYWESGLQRQFSTAIKYSGAMGWAISSSIGAALVNPDKKIVAVVGDGCMLMQGMEIQTAARYGVTNLMVVILNNKAHGNPKLRLGDISEKEHAVTDIPDHKWALFAEALGAKGFTVRVGEDLGSVLSEAVQQEKMVVIDVKCGLYDTPTKRFDESFMKEFNRYIS